MTHENEDYALIVVGAGPAGLAAAVHCVNAGHKTLVIETGRDCADRNHDSSEDIVTGVGGAGLYSDGKFSFFPSASKLWNLPDSDALTKAYNWFGSLLRPHGLNVADFPEKSSATTERRHSYTQKTYPSHYLPFDARTAVIRQMTAIIGPSLKAPARVTRVKPVQGGVEVQYSTPSGHFVSRAKAVVIAGGRFGSLTLESMCPEISRAFRRYEIGVRVQQQSDKFGLKDCPALDPKIIIQRVRDDVEWRTFCTCRDGEIIETNWHGLRTLSGRADGKKTGMSNFGFNLRLLQSALTDQINAEIARILRGELAIFEIPVVDYLAGASAYGAELDKLFRDGLREFAKSFDISESTIHGPCIEGVGHYPDLNSNLKAACGPIWIAGDMTGEFRGLTAALVSGHYVAQKATQHIGGALEWAVPIKESSTQKIPVVFTAQSKLNFFCRDVVCEYALKQGCLPLNPFRVFDYFLNDRVDRDVIRQGNNQLIRISEELWVFGAISDGVLFEIAFARKLGLPVRFFSIGTRVSDIRPVPFSELVFEPEVHARQVKKDDLLAFISGDPSLGGAPNAQQMTLNLISE